MAKEEDVKGLDISDSESDDMHKKQYRRMYGFSELFRHMILTAVLLLQELSVRGAHRQWLDPSLPVPSVP